MSGEKPFTISRWTVFEAWKRVKANNSRLAFDCGSEDTKTIRALGKKATWLQWDSGSRVNREVHARF